MLQGVKLETQKCHLYITPNFLQGAISASRQRHFSHAPTSFIWCRDHLAEMPLLKRTKGRVTKMSQECQTAYALPNQFNGVIVKTQKCRDIVTPREGPA
jgi:hypothetical protein